MNLLKEALSLPDHEKIHLAEQLLSSVDSEDVETTEAWIAEVKKRIKSVESGESNLLDFEALYHESVDT